MVTDLTYDELLEHTQSINEIGDCVLKIINKGKKRVRVLIKTDEGSLEGDIRIVKSEHVPAAMMYFTGSKNLNIRMRGIAKSKGMQLNEYGIKKDGELITFNSEKEIFEFLGMNYISPENR